MTPTRTRSRAAAPAAQPAQTMAVEVIQPKEAITRVSALIDAKRDQLLDLFAGDAAVVDRMKTLTLHALSDPKLMAKLQQADLATVIDAIRQSAALGLMPIPALAEGYFVPYWNNEKRKFDLQFQPGYNGLVKLVLNSGRVLDVDAGVAYENDVLEYEEGSAPFVRHVRALKDRGNRIAAYAVARLAGGIVKVRVLDIATIEQHRKASKAGSSGPWVDWYDPMAQKTALRDLTKYLPKSATLERALMMENEAEERYSPPPAQITAGQSGARSRIRARFGAADPEIPVGDQGGANGAPVPPPEGTETPEGAQAGVSVDPGGATCEVEGCGEPQEPGGVGLCVAHRVDDESGMGAVEDGVTREDDGLCGAESDPKLGDVVRCTEPRGHLELPKAPRIHRAGEVTFPAAKR